MEISACVKYVGVNDHQVDLFEGQYKAVSYTHLTLPTKA